MLNQPCNYFTCLSLVYILPDDLILKSASIVCPLLILFGFVLYTWKFSWYVIFAVLTDD